MNMTRFVVILQILVAGSMAAQERGVNILPRSPRALANSDIGQSAQLRVDSNLVLVPVLVTDPADRLVTGLNKDYFRVYDNNVEQEIRHFVIEDAPVSVVLVFDSSGSMGEKLQTSREAVHQFLTSANPEDEFALVEFSDRGRLTVPFTQDFGEVETRLLASESRGSTSLIDAVWLALDQMKHAHNSRKAVLILSDGGDNRSRHSARELKRRVNEADVQIYSIGIMNPISGRFGTPEEGNGAELLNDIAMDSGGRLFEVDHLESLSRIAVKIATALRNQYLLGYSPSAVKNDGQFHRIIVKLQQQAIGQTKLRATFRSSYRAPE